MQSGHFSRTMPNLGSNPETFEDDIHKPIGGSFHGPCGCESAFSDSEYGSKPLSYSFLPSYDIAPSETVFTHDQSKSKNNLSVDVVMSELPTLIEEGISLTTQKQTSPRNFISSGAFQRSMKVTAKECSTVASSAPPPTRYRRSTKNNKRNRSCPSSRRVFNAMQGFNISMTLSQQRKDLFKRTTSMP
uniref:Uncharacterized protein n=1 Tax=Hanusia phi TaxID=3032 RepID=A0A7S0HGN2_9CRYP|mmetsp:Transcript_25225/g.56887  ORF Transcript_25225/g.56887 Transcript_25225/m.56887 type:complete len:188 (+) Transcript_25225:163-726(+)